MSTGNLSGDGAASESVSEKFNSLSTSSKAAIGACSGAAVIGVLAYAIFFCFRQRKKGVEEAALAAKRIQDDRMELEGYKAAGINPDGFSEQTPTYDPKTGLATRDVLVSENFTSGQTEKFGAQPLLRDGGGYSPPGTPNAHQDAYTNPYTDGFSPVDHNGQGYTSMHPPPSGPLPGVPDQNFGHGGQGQGQGYFR